MKKLSTNTTIFITSIQRNNTGPFISIVRVDVVGVTCVGGDVVDCVGVDVVDWSGGAADGGS